MNAKRIAKWLGIILAVLLAAGLAAPYLSGNRFAPRIRAAMESALGRKVEIGAVHFSLFNGPGFSVEHVVIHENPALGIEPLAYVDTLDAVPRLTSLFRGKLEFASIRLEDASINIAKTGAPSQPGRWNFEPLLSRSVIRAFPEVHVRSGRINFKFGDTKSAFYLLNTDLDIAPPGRRGGAWSLEFSGEPARTDRPARGFGNFMAHGRWIEAGGGRLDLDVRLEPSAIGEMIALVHGNNAGIQGSVSARMHLDGPLDNIAISGNLLVENVYRWDLLPPHGQGWPFRLAGRLNLPGQTLELESRSANGQVLPLAVRFRSYQYLSQPRWSVLLNWNRFPIAPLLELARHMGADLPPKLQMAGWLDGVLGYSGQGGLQGEVDFHNASLVIPDSQPLRAEQARLIFDHGHARLQPAVVRTAQDEEATLEADYAWAAPALSLTISTEAMRVGSLRAQAALAGVPWLEQVPSGTWQGQLDYDPSGWSGDLTLHDARFPVPGLAEPVTIQSAEAHIDGPHIVLEQIRAQAGKLAIQGEYRYEPHNPRPHRLRISIPQAGAMELERLLMPSLRPDRGLLERALGLGRHRIPGWLADRHLDASVQIGSLDWGGAEASAVQAHILWDGAKAQVDKFQAAVAGGRVTGTLSVALHGGRPVYRMQALCQGIQWKSGTVDAEAAVETSGTGPDLLAHLHAAGAFTAEGLEMEALPALESVSGSYDLVWAAAGPRLRFPDLQLVSAGDTYTGQGSTQPDGRLLIQLSSGSKEMKMSGTLAELRVSNLSR
jgi:hypothetical protein